VGGTLARSTLESEGGIIGTRIFVGNLSYDTTQDELQTLFSEAGPVKEVFLPVDRATGRPRGFAFVEFETDQAAADAIGRFDGQAVNGRNCRVSEAAERTRAPSFEGGGGGFNDRPPKGAKPKGSRRNVRARKRGFF
jgi:RNA recognition motif-containing protein